MSKKYEFTVTCYGESDTYSDMGEELHAYLRSEVETCLRDAFGDKVDSMSSGHLKSFLSDPEKVQRLVEYSESRTETCL